MTHAVNAHVELDRIRTERRWSLAKTAQRLQTSKTTVIRTLNGRTKPSLKLALRIQAVTGIDPATW